MQLSYDINYQKSGKNLVRECLLVDEKLFLVLRIYLTKFVSKRGGKYKILFIFAGRSESLKIISTFT